NCFQAESPKNAIMPYVRQILGDDQQEYVHLSDGGHFENLGLYEMIRRRCRCIVVSDASYDPRHDFEDLGNDVRKIAVDLSVDIAFGKLRELKPRSKDDSIVEGAYYAIGVIDYKNAPEWKSYDAPPGVTPESGYILYIKPSYHG